MYVYKYKPVHKFVKHCFAGYAIIRIDLSLFAHFIRP